MSLSPNSDEYINDIKNVAIVVVNWERPLDTIECLTSIFQEKIPQHHVIVVDNGSSDNSVEIIKTKFPQIHLVRVEKNRGFSYGYNIGIQHALQIDVENVLLMNNDTIADPMAIQHLLSTNYDIAVPKILFYDDPSMVWSAGAKWRFFPPAVVMTGFKKKDSSKFDTEKYLEYATACAFLAKRTVFEQIGGFDETFINYMEDFDFFYRANKHGFKIIYIPKSRIYHKVSKTLGESSPQKWFFIGRNIVYFYRKENRFPWWMLIISTVWIMLRELCKGNYRSISSFLNGYKLGIKLIKELQ